MTRTYEPLDRYILDQLFTSVLRAVYIRTPRSTNSQSNTPSQGDDDIYYYSYATSIVLLDLIIHSSAGQKPVFITCMHIILCIYTTVRTSSYLLLVSLSFYSPVTVLYLFFVFLEGKKHCIVFALLDRTCTAHVVACNAIACKNTHTAA